MTVTKNTHADPVSTQGVDSPGALMNRTVIAYEGMAAQWRRALEINAHERLALAHLWESGSMTMSELGDRIPLSRAAVTSLTDRLEALGYVVRTPDRQDRRRTILSLTDLPQRKVMPLAASWGAELQEIATSFNSDEWVTIVRFLDAIREKAHEQASKWRAMSDDELFAAAAAVAATQSS